MRTLLNMEQKLLFFFSRALSHWIFLAKSETSNLEFFFVFYSFYSSSFLNVLFWAGKWDGPKRNKMNKKNVILKFFNHPGDITTSLLFVASNLVCAYYSLQQSHGKYNLCAFTFSYRTLWAPRQSLFRGRAERTEKNLKTSVLKCGSNRQI